MRLKVDLLPADDYADTVLVVDTIRATTTATVYLERGAESLVFPNDIGHALALKDQGFLLAGENAGLAPTGFDIGNSPLQAQARRFDGQTVAMVTTNGTVAIRQAAKSAERVLLACLRNAHAATRKARELANTEVAILCAGTGRRLGLDDIYTAGVLAEYLLAFGDWELDDGARVALTVRRQFADPLEPLLTSQAAMLLRELGLEEDVRYCAEISQSTVVPTLKEKKDDLLIFSF